MEIKLDLNILNRQDEMVLLVCLEANLNGSTCLTVRQFTIQRLEVLASNL